MTNSSKSKLKVRALEEHKPLFVVDVERAEVLLKELSHIGQDFGHKAIEFEEILEFPALRAFRAGEAIDPNLGALLKCFHTSLSDWLMRQLKERDEAITAMKGAIAALRLLRTMRNEKEAMDTAGQAHTSEA